MTSRTPGTGGGVDLSQGSLSRDPPEPEDDGNDGTSTPGIERPSPGPARGVGLVLKRQVRREPSYFKPEYEDDESDDSLVLQIDLSTIDRNLMKQSQTKLGILKENNYYVWAESHRLFLEGRGL